VEHSAGDKDRRVLHALGYAQELSRSMGGFSNFAISFTIISILSGTLTLYYLGLGYGGPVTEAYGWPLVSFFVLIVGLGMAEYRRIGTQPSELIVRLAVGERSRIQEIDRQRLRRGHGRSLPKSAMLCQEQILRYRRSNTRRAEPECPARRPTSPPPGFVESCRGRPLTT